MKKPEWPAKQWDEQLGQRLQQEAPFEPAAWEAMLAKLEVALPPSTQPLQRTTTVERTEKRRRITPVWWMAAASLGILLMVAGLWWSMQNIEQEQQTAGQPNAGSKGGGSSAVEMQAEPYLAKETSGTEQTVSGKSGADAQAAAPDTGNAAAKVSDQQRNNPSSGVETEDLGGSRADLVSTQSGDPGGAAAEASSKRKSSTSAGFRSNGNIDQGITNHQTGQDAQAHQIGLAGEQGGANRAEEGRVPALEEKAEDPLRAKSIAFQHQTPAVIIKVPVIPVSAKAVPHPSLAEETALKPQQPQGRHRWSLSLTATPDLSQVGGLATTKTGWGGGLLLGYQLGQRLRIQAGAIYTKKNYESYESFVPYDGMGSGNYAPDYIDASCGVLDLPLNVQYQFAQGRRIRWYASAGLSSYLMLSEYYNFQYKYYNYEYEYKNENRHWLGVLNAGVGLEAPLSKRISLQAEPYYKLPIRGVGAGQIRLTSFGALLQLRYKL